MMTNVKKNCCMRWRRSLISVLLILSLLITMMSAGLVKEAGAAGAGTKDDPKIVTITMAVGETKTFEYTEYKAVDEEQPFEASGGIVINHRKMQVTETSVIISFTAGAVGTAASTYGFYKPGSNTPYWIRYDITVVEENIVTDGTDLSGVLLSPNTSTFDKSRHYLTKTSLTLTTGKKTTIKLNKATVKKVKWKSSKKSVATVKKGTIMAKKPGKATITATYQKKKYTCKVTVKSNIKLSKTNFVLSVKGTKTLILQNVKASKVKWTSSNKKVATVKKGKITAKKGGTAVITATYQKKKYTCKITVFSLQKIGTGKITQEKPVAKIGNMSVEMDPSFINDGDQISISKVNNAPKMKGYDTTAYDLTLNGKGGELGGVAQIRLPYNGQKNTVPVASNYNESTQTWEAIPCYLDGDEVVVLTDHFSVKTITNYPLVKIFTDPDSVLAKIDENVAPEYYLKETEKEKRAQEIFNGQTKVLGGENVTLDDVHSALDWYNTIFGYITQGGEWGAGIWSELGFSTQGSAWFSKYSDSITYFGLALSAFDVIWKAYNGDHKGAWTTLAKTISTTGLSMWMSLMETQLPKLGIKVAKGIGAAAGLAVGFIDYALNDFATTAFAMRKDAWAKAYQLYLKEESNAVSKTEPEIEKVLYDRYGGKTVATLLKDKKMDKSKPLYWRAVLTPYFDGRYSEIAIESRIVTLVQKYTEGFFDIGDEAIIYYQSANGVNPGGIYSNAVKEELLKDCQNDLYHRAIIPAIRAIIEQRKYEAQVGMEEAKKYSISLTNEVLKIHFYDSSYRFGDACSGFKGYTVRFKNIPNTVKKKMELECKLNSDGEGTISVTFAGYFLHNLRNEFVVLDEYGKQVGEIKESLTMPQTDIDIAANSDIVDYMTAHRPKLSAIYLQMNEKEAAKIGLSNDDGLGAKWTTSDNTVAVVTGYGNYAVITAKKAGTAIIKATCKEKPLYCTVEVQPYIPELTDNEIYVGETIDLSAQNLAGVKSDNAAYVLYGKNWKNSNKSVLSMGILSDGFEYVKLGQNQKGTYKVTNDYGARIKGLKPGTAVISVTAYEPPHTEDREMGQGGATYTVVIPSSYSKQASVTITVKERPSKMTLSSTKMTLTAGKSKSLTLSGTAKGSIQWTSSKPGVVTVSGSGKKVTIKAVKKGTAVIKAVCDGKSYSCVVTVKKKASNSNNNNNNTQKITKEVFVGSYDVGIGKTITIKPPKTGSVKWSTSNANFCTVNSKGVVTGRGQGSCYVYADIGNTRYKWEIWAGSYE